jgi:hypothetical protein
LHPSEDIEEKDLLQKRGQRELHLFVSQNTYEERKESEDQEFFQQVEKFQSEKERKEDLIKRKARNKKKWKKYPTN